MKRWIFYSFCLCVCLILWVGIKLLERNKWTANFEVSKQALINPLMGFAPPAENVVVREDVQLLYVDVSWRELEPYKGVYDWEKIEESNQFSRWRAEGKRLVLRFVLDVPGPEAHADIPDWLLEELVDPGEPYQTTYGQGFSPNYADETLLEAYQVAVAAMGNRWGDDDFISYIELGGLGHWGEWHVDQTAGIKPLPDESVRMAYVNPWLRAFPEAELLMRRPFEPVARYGLGLYNDVFGEVQGTQTWLNWIEKGGDYDQTGELGSLKAQPLLWQRSPIGGELTSSLPMSQLLGTDLSLLLHQLENSHVSFLGPKVAEPHGDTEEVAYEQIRQRLGYAIGIRQAEVTLKQEKGQLRLHIFNQGSTPFYKDWSFYVIIKGINGQELGRQALPVRLSSLLPGQEIQVGVDLPLLTKKIVKTHGLHLDLQVTDPLTAQPGLRFAVKGQESQTSLQLFDQEVY